MVDRDAFIEIGGRVDQSVGLLDWVQHENLGVGEWDGEVGREYLRAELAAASREQRPARFYSQLGCGLMEALKAYCREHSLPYAHWCGGDNESDPDYEFWYPGLAAPRHVAADAAYNIVILADVLEDALRRAAALRDNGVDAVLAVFRDLSAAHARFNPPALELP